jgi:hypothetical protein
MAKSQVTFVMFAQSPAECCAKMKIKKDEKWAWDARQRTGRKRSGLA